MPGEHLLRIDCEVDSAPVASLSVPLLVPAVVPIGGDKNALTGKLNVVVDGISSMVSSSSSSSRGANIDSTSGKESDTGSVSVSADISVSLVGSLENTAPQKSKTRMHPLCELIVRENSTVLSLKDQLFTDWDALRTETLIPEKPPTVHHIRLRDAKVCTSNVQLYPRDMQLL